MRKSSFPFLFLLVVTTISNASTTPSGIWTSLSLAASSLESCDLRPPETFAATAEGTTWATLSWSVVTDANRYVLRTYSGMTLVNETYVPGNVGTVTITGLQPGTSYRTIIACVCQNAEESPHTNEAPFQTFILDLVTSQFSQNSMPPSCTMIANGNSQCDFVWNGSLTRFKVSTSGVAENSTEDSKWFSLSVNSFEHVIFGVNGNGGNYTFWGVTANAGAPFYQLPPALKVNFVQLRYNEKVVADLFVEYNTFTGKGLIKLGPSGIMKNHTIAKMDGPEENNLSTNNESSSAIREDASLTERGNGFATIPKKEIVMANPFSEQISLKIKSDVEDLVSIQLFDLNGRLVQMQDYAGGETHYSLQTNNVTPGMYLLRVEIGAFVANFKVIKAQ